MPAEYCTSVNLSLEELGLLVEGLDSYAYWEIGETHTRNNGSFDERELDPEDEEDADAMERFLVVKALWEKLEARQGHLVRERDKNEPYVPKEAPLDGGVTFADDHQG